MEEMQQDNMSWIEVQFILITVTLLLKVLILMVMMIVMLMALWTAVHVRAQQDGGDAATQHVLDRGAVPIDNKIDVSGDNSDVDGVGNSDVDGVVNSCTRQCAARWRRCSNTTCPGSRCSSWRRRWTSCVCVARHSCTPTSLPSTSSRTTSPSSLRSVVCPSWPEFSLVVVGH